MHSSLKQEHSFNFSNKKVLEIWQIVLEKSWNFISQDVWEPCVLSLHNENVYTRKDAFYIETVPWPFHVGSQWYTILVDYENFS